MYFPYGATRPKQNSAAQSTPVRGSKYQQEHSPNQLVPGSTPVAQAGSFGALPSSHSELRQRLESAGVPADQIASVLLGSDPVTEPVPALPLRPQQVQQPLTHQSQPNNFVVQPQSYQSQSTDYAVQLPQSSHLVFNVHVSPIEENFRANHINYCTHVVVPPGTSHHHPSYTTVFSNESNWHKEPHLRIYRNVGNKIDKSARREIGTCLYHHEMSEKIEIKHPWMDWGKWEPEYDWWTSDVGTLQGASMQWHYGWKDPQNPRCFVIRNVTSNEALEVCKVILLGEDNARIELADYAFDGCTDEQRDEMVSNALIQMFRKWTGWTSARMQHTIDARQGSGPSVASTAAGRTARMGLSMMAGGGGGGC